jgi:hypothetical protein
MDIENQSSTQETNTPEVTAQPAQRDSELDNLLKPEQSLTELEKLEKFKFNGQEYTPKDLEKSILRQSDYTKKMQEISELKKEYEPELKHRDYRANLKADIGHVLKDPSLAEAFKKTYPEEYHVVLEYALAKTQQPDAKPAETPAAQLPPEFLKKFEEQGKTLDEFKQKAYETEKQATDAQLDAYETKYTGKYPYSKDVLGQVYGALETYAAQNKITNIKNIPESVVEHVYKNAHEQMEKIAEKINEQRVKKQLSAHKDGQDIGKGGGTPGEAPKKIRLRDVADHVLSENQ